jgi:hypothetical protein
MALLLSWAQQQAIKKFSANNAGKYDQLAAEVEENELRSMLGVALLQDLQDNPTETNNATLLTGGTYTDRNENTIRFRGIRYILAYLNYSRYIGESFVNDTFTGMVRKVTPDSEPLSEGTMKRLQSENRQIAMSEWDIVRDFLNTNKENYPLWGDSKTKKPFTPRIYGVRKTHN